MGQLEIFLYFICMVQGWKVYIVETKNEFGSETATLSLTSNEVFRSYNDAIEWIKNKGRLNLEYTILEIFRNP